MRRAALPLAAVFLAQPAMAGSVQDTTEAFVRAANGSDGTAFARLFTPDAAITDTFAPYAWSGPGAASRYFADLGRAVAAVRWTAFSIVRRAPEADMARGDDAYASVPLAVVYTVHGATRRDEGVFVFALRREQASWRIRSATWLYTRR